MDIISLTNLKGGSSKSNGVFSFSTGFSHIGASTKGTRETGRRVLVVDVDPQGSQGASFLNATTTDALPKENTVATLFDANAPPSRPSDLIRPTGIPGVDLLPSNITLAEYNTNTPVDPSIIPLAQFLAEAEVRTRYDLCLIDTPPSMQRCTMAALASSDWAIIPVICELPAILGISHVLKTIDAVKVVNPRLQLLGLMITMFDSRLSVHKVYEQTLRERYGSLVFEQKIPLSSTFKEAIVNHTPVTVGAPKSAAATAIRTLVDEIDRRIRCHLDWQPGSTDNGQG